MDKSQLERLNPIRYCTDDPPKDIEILLGIIEELDAECDDADEHLTLLNNSSFGQFRREVREALAIRGIITNPGWSDHSIIEELRKALRGMVR